MKQFLMPLALALPLWCSAQTVWRCGPDARVYSDTPCSEGRRVDVPQARPASDVHAAQQQARLDIRQAELQRRERLAQEAMLRGNGMAALGPRATEIKPTLLVIAKPHRKRQAASPEANGIWRATVPASRQKPG